MAANLKPIIDFWPMTLADLPMVLRIEAENYHYPWTEGIFRDCIKVDYQCHVYASDGEIFAYSIVSNLAAECHILNVSVSPSMQGLGYGRYIVEQILDAAIALGSQQAILEVRPTNRIARNLYVSMGFEQIGIRKDYYPAGTGREDAYVLAYNLITRIQAAP